MTDLFSDNRSGRFIFVPPCVFAQALHAKGIAKYEWTGPINQIIQLLLDSGVNIRTMPCMETIFNGLDRETAGRKDYDTYGFRVLCANRAALVTGDIKALLKAGYDVIAILGMEYSPSCAIKIQYPPKKGGGEQPGIFMEELQRALTKNDLNIPFLGINRAGIKPTLKRLEAFLNTPQ